MAEAKLYKILLSETSLKEFLINNNLYIDPGKIEEMNLLCRNPNCLDPSKGFRKISRKRNIIATTAVNLSAEGQNITRLECLRCKGCGTSLSPRTNGFLTYTDNLGRSNVKIAPEKVLQICFHWICGRPIIDSSKTLDLTSKMIVDWHNFCRQVCVQLNRLDNDTLMGNGQGRGPNGETPQVVIQIDECLLRGKRLYNRGRLLLGNNAIPEVDRVELEHMEIDPEAPVENQRNYGRRITGPWIFGLIECHKTEDGSYKSGKFRLFHVNRRNTETLLPIIRANVQKGSMVWSDEWRAYFQIGNEDGLLHETVNHSINFVSPTGTHTQNIERLWSKLKLKLIKNMRGTSPALLESHLQEFMYKSRNNEPLWEKYISFLQDAAGLYPVTWE